MTVTEKAAYLKGLLEGMKIGTETNEGKLFSAIVDAINDIALEVSDIQEQTDAINDELDSIEETLEAYDEEFDSIDKDLDELYEQDDDCCCDDDCCDCDDCGDDCCCDEEDAYYETECPTCGEKIVLDEDLMAKGEMKCPACGEDLEFDFSEIDKECDCCCEDKE